MNHLTHRTVLLAVLIFANVAPACAQPLPERNNASLAPIDLRETLRPSALKDVRSGNLSIVGRVSAARGDTVRIRVTTGTGKTSLAEVASHNGRFQAAYPADFAGAPPLTPSVLFVDAALTPFSLSETKPAPSGPQAEATLIVYDSRRHLAPDFPSAFTANLRDRRGKRDQEASEWPVMCTLVNLYMHSYGAQLAGVGKPDFDLARPDGLAFFRKNLALYDFDHRDRDWSQPLGHRVRRTLWQSVWDNWFNSSNDHPLDGNSANRSPDNYLPYAFTNDLADILIQHLMRLRLTGSVEDDLLTMCRDVVENLLACQHRTPDNFALSASNGGRENYTAGAFRYGLFVSGDFLIEGKGWFYNPAFRDYADGGVLNGRAVWALGEALRAEPKGPLAARLKGAVALAVQFCLNDAIMHGYAKRTKQGRVYWRDAGEHAYLTLGMVNACAISPSLTALKPASGTPLTLRAASADALNALCDLQKSEGQWAVYPNVDSMAIVALAEGALVLRDHPDAAKWRKAAEKAAKGWLHARVDTTEFRGTPVHFGLRLTPDTMTYRWHKLDANGWQDHNYLFFYQTGHWIHALSRLYALTGDPEYRLRAEAMIAYLCGDNPWGIRLLNEMGGVYNWVEDKDGDGVEEALKQDMYPESTAFTQIGIFHFLRAIGGAPRG